MRHKTKKTKRILNRSLSFLLAAGLILCPAGIGGIQAFAAAAGGGEDPVSTSAGDDNVGAASEIITEVSGSDLDSVVPDNAETTDPAEDGSPDSDGGPDAYASAGGYAVSPAADGTVNEMSEGLSGDVNSVPLASEGQESIAAEWAYNETRTLNITADFTGTVGDRILRIEMPVGMVFNEGGYPTAQTDPQTIINCDYAASVLPKNYTAKETGGLLTYKINPNVDTISLRILISYDERLWNKKMGNSVTGEPGDGTYQPPVRVTKEADGAVETKQLSKILTSTAAGEVYSVKYDKDASLTSAKVLDQAVYAGRHYIYIGRDSGQINSTPNMYWKKVILTQYAPYKELEGGGRVYADVVEGATVSPGNQKSVSYDNEQHKIEVIWTENASFNYSAPQINAKFQFSKSSGFGAGDTVIYPSPVIRAAGIYGEEYDLFNQTDEKQYARFTLGDKEELLLKWGSVKPFLTSATNENVVYHLGTCTLANMGAVPSGKKEVTYSFEGKKGVGVTTLRLIMPRKACCELTTSGKVKVTYTVLDRDGNSAEYVGSQEISPAQGANDNSGNSVIISRDQEMISKGYFFHTITYQVKTLEAGTLYYNGSSPFTSGGSFYGKLTGSTAKPAAGEECLAAAITIKSLEDQEPEVSAGYSVIGTNDAPKTTMGLRNDPLAGINSTIPAGGTLTVDAKLQISEYPYYSATYVEEPVFYLRLPETLSLVKGSLKTDRKNVGIVVQEPVTETEADGVICDVIPITFTGDVSLGYYDETLQAVDGKDSLTLTFTLQASQNTSSIKLYDLRDLVCVGARDACLSNNNSGWNPHNWKHNPTVEDGYSKGLFRSTYSYNGTTHSVFTVQAAAPMIDFKAEVKVHEDKAASDYAQELTFMENTGALDYRLSFSNNKEGTVDGNKFYYLIQIPKSGKKMSDHMTSSVDAPQFSFSLTQAAKLQNQFSGLYDIRYSYDYPADPSDVDFYNNGKADFSNEDGRYAAYYEEGTITQENKWGEVCCIKLVVKDTVSPRIIPDGEECTITLENVLWDVSDAAGDTEFAWSACGLQHYDLGSQSSEGHTPTMQPVVFRIHPYIIDSSATLTGVRQGNSANGTTKTTELLIPAYRKARTLVIKSVEVNGIELVTSGTVAEKNKDNVDPEWGNTHFALTAELSSGVQGPVDILKTGQSSGEIGLTPPGKTSKLSFTLQHANLMTTKSVAGTVTVVIGDDDVNITERITIRTIGTEMNEEDLSSGIFEGKKFSDMGEGGTAVQITSNSSVSAQFNVNNYLYNSYGVPYITGNFPGGSALILADISNGRQPRYYYHQCTEAKEQILLSEFTDMADGTSGFTQESLPVDAKMVFVLDYAQTGQNLEATGNMTLVFPALEGGAQTPRSQTVSWNISPKREFTIDITDSGEGISMTDYGQVGLKASLGSNMLYGNDTYHYSYYLTLSVTLYDASGINRINFPAGATVTANGVTTTAVENKALLSLGKVGVLGVGKTFPLDILLKTADWGFDPGDYTMKLELFCSRAEGYVSAVSSEIEAEGAVHLHVSEETSYGLKVEQTAGKRLVQPGAHLEFRLDYAAGQDPIFSAQLYEKTDGTYNQLNTSWTGEPFFMKNSDGTCTAAIQLPEIAPGTYRILFRMDSGGEVFEVPYNVIVSE